MAFAVVSAFLSQWVNNDAKYLYVHHSIIWTFAKIYGNLKMIKNITNISQDNLRRIYHVYILRVKILNSKKRLLSISNKINGNRKHPKSTQSFKAMLFILYSINFIYSLHRSDYLAEELREWKTSSWKIGSVIRWLICMKFTS